MSYRDVNFTYNLWKGLFEGFGTNMNMSTTYNTLTDSQIERANQVIEDMLRMCVVDQPSKWEDYFHMVEFSYNNGVTAANFWKNLDPPFLFYLPWIYLVSWTLFFFLCYKFGLFEVELRSAVFILFRKLLFFCQCFWLWSLKFDLKMMPFDLNDFLHCYRKSIYVESEL